MRQFTSKPTLVCNKRYQFEQEYDEILVPRGFITLFVILLDSNRVEPSQKTKIVKV